MKIALDFDNCFTLDPDLWIDFVHLAKAHGHEVRVVTGRDDRYDRTTPLTIVENILPVIYTRGMAKRWYVERFAPDFPVDVWIDDLPERILENSPTSPEALAEWRATRPDGQHVGDLPC